MSVPYPFSYRQKLEQEPLRQRLRHLAHLMHKLVDRYRRADMERVLRTSACPGTLKTSAILRPPNHRYAGYRGPWIEERFCRHWLSQNRPNTPRYLPIFWTDYYLWGQTQMFSPDENEAIQEAIHQTLEAVRESPEGFFTVIEYDHPVWDWHRFPTNCLVFSSGGGGDIPIPLLARPRPLLHPEKNIPLSFMGRTNGASDWRGLRSEMAQVLAGYAEFDLGPHWESVLARSTFSLCPRGLGLTSFRLYESLSYSAIPIYIWEDRCWLPYRNELDWDQFSLIVHRSELRDLRERIARISPECQQAMRDYLRKYYDSYFTYDGTCRYIANYVAQLRGPDAIREITAGRLAETRA